MQPRLTTQIPPHFNSIHSYDVPFFTSEHRSPVDRIDLYANGALLLSDGTIYSYNFTQSTLKIVGSSHRATNLKVAPNGTDVFCTSDKHIFTINMAEGQTSSRHHGHAGSIHCICVSQNGQYVCTISHDLITMWEGTVKKDTLKLGVVWTSVNRSKNKSRTQASFAANRFFLCWRKGINVYRITDFSPSAKIDLENVFRRVYNDENVDYSTFTVDAFFIWQKSVIASCSFLRRTKQFCSFLFFLELDGRVTRIMYLDRITHPVIKIAALQSNGQTALFLLTSNARVHLYDVDCEVFMAPPDAIGHQPVGHFAINSKLVCFAVGTKLVSCQLSGFTSELDLAVPDAQIKHRASTADEEKALTDQSILANYSKYISTVNSNGASPAAASTLSHPSVSIFGISPRPSEQVDPVKALETANAEGSATTTELGVPTAPVKAKGWIKPNLLLSREKQLEKREDRRLREKGKRPLTKSEVLTEAIQKLEDNFIDSISASSPSTSRSTKTTESLYYSPSVLKCSATPGESVVLSCVEEGIGKQPMLNPRKLRKMLLKYGQYPEKYRPLIWKTLLKLPRNEEEFVNLCHRGAHFNTKWQLEDYGIKFGQQRVALERTLNCLSWQCTVFANIKFLPETIYPFVRVFSGDAVLAFEGVLSWLLNWGCEYFQFYPNTGINIILWIEMVLQMKCNELYTHMVNISCSSASYIWPILKSTSSLLFTRNEWLQLFDHVISMPPIWYYYFIVAYLLYHKETLMSFKTKEHVEAFLKKMGECNLGLIIEQTYNLFLNKPVETPEIYSVVIEVQENKKYRQIPHEVSYIVNYQSKIFKEIEEEEKQIMAERKQIIEMHRRGQEQCERERSAIQLQRHEMESQRQLNAEVNKLVNLNRLEKMKNIELATKVKVDRLDQMAKMNEEWFKCNSLLDTVKSELELSGQQRSLEERLHERREIISQSLFMRELTGAEKENVNHNFTYLCSRLGKDPNEVSPVQGQPIVDTAELLGKVHDLVTIATARSTPRGNTSSMNGTALSREESSRVLRDLDTFRKKNAQGEESRMKQVYHASKSSKEHRRAPLSPPKAPAPSRSAQAKVPSHEKDPMPLPWGDSSSSGETNHIGTLPNCSASPILNTSKQLSVSMTQPGEERASDDKSVAANDSAVSLANNLSKNIANVESVGVQSTDFFETPQLAQTLPPEHQLQNIEPMDSHPFKNARQLEPPVSIVHYPSSKIPFTEYRGTASYKKPTATPDTSFTLTTPSKSVSTLTSLDSP